MKEEIDMSEMEQSLMFGGLFGWLEGDFVL